MFIRVLTAMFAACLLVPQISTQQPSGKNRVKVRKGVYLKFETMQPVHSATATIGDPVPLRLARPLVVDGITVLQKGDGPFTAVVSKVVKAGPNCQNGRLDIRMDHVIFADGSSAKSMVTPEFSGSFGWVPEYVPNQSAGAGDGVKSVLGMLPLLPVIPVAAALHQLGTDSGSRQAGPPCITPGQDEIMPAGTTIAVWITKTHRVRY